MYNYYYMKPYRDSYTFILLHKISRFIYIFFLKLEKKINLNINPKAFNFPS